MSLSETLLGNAGDVVVPIMANGVQSQIATNVQWNGRKYLNCLQNSLLLFGTGSTFICAIQAYNPMSIPAIPFWGYAATATVLTCAAGCVIRCALPKSSFEEKFVTIEEHAVLQNQLKKATAERNALDQTLRQTTSELGEQTQEIKTASSAVLIAAHQLAHTAQTTNELAHTVININSSLAENLTTMGNHIDETHKILDKAEDYIDRVVIVIDEESKTPHQNGELKPNDSTDEFLNTLEHRMIARDKTLITEEKNFRSISSN